MGKAGPELERFMEFTDRTGECWLWKGALHGGEDGKGGYATFRVNGRVTRVHRWAYEHFVGPIPEGLTIDHLCRNRHCVNPKHLEPVTHRENVLRGISPYAKSAAKTHCKYGHEFTPENTIIRRGTQRECIACMRRRGNGWRAPKGEHPETAPKEAE